MGKELVRDIKDKVQFLVTVEIFYSTITYGFFKAMGASEAISNNNASVWGIGVAMCIASYIVIEKVRGEKILNWIRGLIYTNLIFFIPLIIFTTLVQYKPLPDEYKWPFIISLWGSLWMPIITFPVIVFALIVQFFIERSLANKNC